MSSTMPAILNVEPEDYAPRARQILQEVATLHERPLDRASLLRELPHYDGLIVRFRHTLDREVLAANPRLQFIATATTGLDHIDQAAAQEHSITILSLKGETDFLRTIHATAEHTWALLLALLRNLPAAVEAVRQGGWERQHFRGNELHGTLLGIVGYGRIGEKVSRYAEAFGMRVLAYDPYRHDIPSSVPRGATLDAVLVAADVVSLHVPLNDQTSGLLGARELAMMKPGALLINTARGALLDEAALLAALTSGHLGGAALDVLCDEASLGPAATHPLIAYARTHPNLLITPHIGGATYESMAKTEIFIAEKIRTFLAQLQET